MTSKVYVALRVKATPERAFAVFTGEIGVWWRPQGLFQTTPRAPGVLSFEETAAGSSLSWHNAAALQYVVTLSGTRPRFECSRVCSTAVG